jgi:4-carboxymuconolactone decarboxylase
MMLHDVPFQTWLTGLSQGPEPDPGHCRGHYCSDMSRLPYLRYDDLGPRAQEVWDGVVGTRGGELVTAEGGLVGPFNAFVHAPEVGRHMSALGARLRYRTSLPRRLSELAIITVGARWKAEFEWWAHARMALEHGISTDVVEAIGRGDAPLFAADAGDERAVYAAARQLAAEGRLDDGIYAAAHGLLGDEGMVELVALCGYYTLISYLLNAFDVPLPPGAERQWDDSARA